MRASILAAFASAGLGLAACAPVYQDFTRYEAPTGQAGLQCLAEAEADRADCLRESRDAYEFCREGRRREAERALDIALDEFDIEDRRYRRCRGEVERQQWARHEAGLEETRRIWRKAKEDYRRCVKRVERGAAESCNYPGDSPPLRDFDTRAFERATVKACGFEPDTPQLGDFENYSACGAPEGSCKKLYDAAYRACGGTVIIETRCIANCE